MIPQLSHIISFPCSKQDEYFVQDGVAVFVHDEISIPRSTRAWESNDKLSLGAACEKITSSGLRRAAVLDICSEV